MILKNIENILKSCSNPASSNTLRISVARPVADTHLEKQNIKWPVTDKLWSEAPGSSNNLVATHLQQQKLDLQFRSFVPGASRRMAASQVYSAKTSGNHVIPEKWRYLEVKQ